MKENNRDTLQVWYHRIRVLNASLTYVKAFMERVRPWELGITIHLRIGASLEGHQERFTASLSIVHMPSDLRLQGHSGAGVERSNNSSDTWHIRDLSRFPIDRSGTFVFTWLHENDSPQTSLPLLRLNWWDRERPIREAGKPSGTHRKSWIEIGSLDLGNPFQHREQVNRSETSVRFVLEVIALQYLITPRDR